MTDLNRLVRRVSESLGPAATADRVEAVCRILLDEMTMGHGTAGDRVHQDSNRVVVTFSGSPQRASAKALERALTDAGCIIHATHDLGEFFLLNISTPDPGGSLSDLQARLDVVAASHGGRVGVLADELFNVMNGPGGLGSLFSTRGTPDAE